KAVFLPNDRHGFKGNAVLDFDHRIELIRKAITGQTTENRNAPPLYPGIECWDADSRQYGSGWTDELMQRLSGQYPDAYFCFVIGADNLPSLDRWHNFAWLAENVHFIIVPRLGQSDVSPLRGLGLGCRLPVCRGSASLHTLPKMVSPLPGLSLRFSWVEMPMVPVSSSDIRARIRTGKSISGLVPELLEPDIIRLYSDE
ncbi:MAG: nicotinate-nicotinamide nucleotide adenylyltransferase, partial [Candidatus Cloacimonetes bacterium]|nr:nicotinate-nicotinamide nucleotide adenylyltransferase [Candidatus Cloacimonadota bacterium]